jgi:putative phage-type endonuclease
VPRTVLAADASRVDWLTARRSGLGGTDVAAIFGVHRFQSPLGVWLDKTSADTVDEGGVSEAAEWGQRLEPVLRAKFAEVHPELVVHDPPGLLAHPRYPWALATPDGLLTPTTTQGDPTGTALGIWEGKTASQYLSGDWTDDDVPEGYLLQVHWYLAVTGADYAHISALVGGQRYLERFVVRDDDLADLLIERAGAWWHTHVVEGAMPDPDANADSQRLNRLWLETVDEPVEVPADLVDELRAQRALRDLVAEQCDHLEAQLRVQMGDHEVATCGGQTVATWRWSRPVARLDANRLRAAYPALAAEFTTTGTGSRRLLIKKTAEDNA